MELKVIGSGSSGNSYALVDSKGAILLLEAGCPLRKIKQAVSYRVKDIVGCLITHEHGDHAKYAKDVLEKTSVPVFATIGTIDALQVGTRRGMRPLRDGKAVRLGDYTIMPILLQQKGLDGEILMTHDAAEPVCYQIHHPEMGLLAFVTDTRLMPCRFNDLSHLMIECNYETNLLERNVREGRVSKSRRDRTVMTHMSLDNCLAYLKMINLSKMKNIVLVHLSKDNADPERFKTIIGQCAQKDIQVAAPGLTVDLTINNP